MKNLFFKTTNYIKENKEKVIVAVLFVIFIAVSIGAFWDLYGKNMFASKTTPTPTPVSSISPQPSIPGSVQTQKGLNGKGNKPPKNEQVDTTQFASCMTGLTTKKECKDCCEGLNLDTALNDTCRKTCNRAISQ